MEVRIRLQRSGKAANKKYNFRIVAITRPINRDGKHLELLGHYDPSRNPAIISIDQEKLNQWVKRGAQMSDTVKSLVKKVNKK